MEKIVGFISICGFFVLFSISSKLAYSDIVGIESETVLGFGSCLKEQNSQAFWNVILAKNPDAFILGGDNVYADSGPPEQIKDHYDVLGSNSDYQNLRNKVKILATWDDHDFGKNDGGADFIGKDIARLFFLDFFQVSSTSPRRSRSGIYDSEILNLNGKKIQIILLDVRYNRSPLTITSHSIGGKPQYGENNDPSATMLGAEQWVWLVEQFQQTADIRIIVSSTQFVARDHKREKWSNFPLEKKRMINLIKTTDAKGVLFVSGDRHHAQIYKMETKDTAYPLYDMTTSGLNRQMYDTGVEQDRYSLTETYKADNFGLIRIDWGASKLFLEIYKIDGKLRDQIPVNFSEIGI